MMTRTAGQVLGEYLGGFSQLELAYDIREKALMCLFDTLGLALSAQHEPTAQAALSSSQLLPDNTQASASAWIMPARISASEAALANGVAAHAHFQDDTDIPSWTHPGSLVPPAVVALAERQGATLLQVLNAIVAGYSTINWLGRDEVVSRKLIARGLRTSPTFGTIAAAAGCAALLRLNAAQAASAVSIAASITGGTLEPVRAGSDEWRVQNGRAAQGGLIAALMASSGVSGAPEALDGPKGFLATLAGIATMPEVWITPPDPATMLKVVCKPYATLGDNMPAAMAAQKLFQDGIEPNQIEAIEVTLWEPFTAYPGTNFTGPFTRLVQTQASTAFAVATMLTQGDITYDMGNSLRDDPAILNLVARTVVLPDEAIGALDSKLVVRMKDGSRRSAVTADLPRDLIYLTRTRTLAVFESRMARLGVPAGRATTFASRLFDGLGQGKSPSMREVMTELHSLGASISKGAA
ncbi:MmgE/PrpD family protein [Paracoccus sp. (in: a-proteobacteria)]|uniref:MmgE/PrpD family protein n=1 Tax=Paracoccus sp. TaxID=267 RepID=UPI0028A1346C|nr:MmgE/PrpD family protein [Paracoccus sp. (in: a-proteobacteria)]